jgi:phosphate transport system permease protein
MSEREIMTERSERSEPSEPLPAPRVGGESVDREAASSHDGRGLHMPIESEVALGGTHTDASKVSGSGIASGGGRARIGDRVFYGLSSAAAGSVILIVVLIATFLLIKSVPSITGDKVNFVTSTEWSPDPTNLRFGIANLLWVTVIISLVSLVVAVPIAIGIALFVTQYAPPRLARPIAYVVDLLAAIPSIVYGIWGATVLSSALEPVQRAFSHIPLPLFGLKQPNGTIFDGAIVLAVMILPIITAISRDVFERTPTANIEAALALGATRYEMIRMAVLPYGRAGVVSGSMLGLGRALGETIAVYLILSTVGGRFSFSIFNGGETFASKIANGSSEFNNPTSTGAYIAAGLVLFVLTFVVNSAARAIVNRRKDFA